MNQMKRRKRCLKKKNMIIKVKIMRRIMMMMMILLDLENQIRVRCFLNLVARNKNKSKTS